MIQEITEFRYFSGKFVTKFGSESSVRGEYKYDMILFLEMQLLKGDLLLIHNYSCFRKKNIFDLV